MKYYEETEQWGGRWNSRSQTRRWCLIQGTGQGVAGQASFPGNGAAGGSPRISSGQRHMGSARPGVATRLGFQADGRSIRHGRGTHALAWLQGRGLGTQSGPRAWKDGTRVVPESRTKAHRDYTDFGSWQRKPVETGRHSLGDSLLQVGVHGGKREGVPQPGGTDRRRNAGPPRSPGHPPPFGAPS